MCRLLTNEEIECRAAQAGKSARGAWCSFLLYKDARVDQRILDETYGPMNWRRSHEMIGDRLFCTVSVWDAEKKEWVAKQDVGVESSTEKEKGQASDAFKRACFNWGIGRELYTAPKILVNLKEGEYRTNSDRISPTLSLSVSEIGYDGQGRISSLTLTDRDGEVRFRWAATPEEAPEKDAEREKPEPSEKKADKEKKETSRAKSAQAREAAPALPVIAVGDEPFSKWTEWMAKHWGEPEVIEFGTAEMRKKFTVSDKVLASMRERAAFLSDLHGA